MKEVKIVKVAENVRRFTGRNGETFIHEVTIEGDPIPWEYHSLKATCEKLQPQTTAFVDMEEKQNGQYLNRKISPAKEAPRTLAASKAPWKSDKDQAQICWLSCFSSVCNLYQGGINSLDMKKVLTATNEAFEEARKHTDKN